MLKALLRSVLFGRSRGREQISLEAAVALAEADRMEEAETMLRAFCLAQPEHADGRLWLGRVLYRQKKIAAALAVLEQAVELAPANADAHYLLGRALTDNREFAAAAEALRRVVELEPAWGPGPLALADALDGMGDVDAAEDNYQRALELAPTLATAAYNYGNLLNRVGRIDEGIACYRRALAINPEFRGPYTNMLFALTRSDTAAPEEIFRAHEDWARRYAEPLTAAAEPCPARPRTHAKVKVGYVSPDFRDHPVSYFLQPVLESHDRATFEICCYSDVPVPDAYTARLRGFAQVWRDTHTLSDEALARLVREDRVDILVDLAGHTRGDRLLAFARRAAPIQVTWMGYPNTTGLSAMDYRLSDPYADPPGMTEHLHSERLVRLPEIYMPFAEPADALPIGPLPALARGHVTFGSFNIAAKLTPSMLRLWARVLRALPAARLMVLDLPAGRSRQRIKHMLAEEGVAPGQLDLRGRLSYREYWAAYNEVDIALDTHPCSGTTTTAHALWMGLPPVTLPGATHASRVATTMLTNAGLAEFVARSEEDYVAIAVSLAQNLPRLQALRAGLRDSMRASPNMDGARFTRFLEAAYTNMWKDYRASAA